MDKSSFPQRIEMFCFCLPDKSEQARHPRIANFQRVGSGRLALVVARYQRKTVNKNGPWTFRKRTGGLFFDPERHYSEMTSVQLELLLSASLYRLLDCFFIAGCKAAGLPWSSSSERKHGQTQTQLLTTPRRMKLWRRPLMS
jgi:hypothetical protein